MVHHQALGGADVRTDACGGGEGTCAVGQRGFRR